MSRATQPREVIYPESDGKPMAETDVHRDWMVCIIERLKWRYRRKRVYVSGNLLIYYEKGIPKKCVAPDTFVVFGVHAGRRRIFKVWEEGKSPDFALETTSDQREDQKKKKDLYALLKVPEYFLYDPLGDWLDPPLQGLRLVNGEYERIPPESDGSVVSKVLGIRFVLEDGDLAMFDVVTGERILSDGERADEAERRLASEVAARKQLEEEIARLKAKRGNGPARNGG